MKRISIMVFLSAFMSLSAYPGGLEVPRDTSFTRWSAYLKVRKKHPEVTLLSDSVPDGISVQKDVVYSTIEGTSYGDRELHADVFRPDDGASYPALIMIHGGGWNSGDKTLQHPMARLIAAKGYVAIPVEYRLIPEAIYPAGLEDIKTAVRWVRKNAVSLGVNPDKIALSGCSAGAQLATLVGVTNGSLRHEGGGEWKDSPSTVQAVVNMDGVSTFVSRSNINDAEERLAKKGVMPVCAQWLGGMYEDAADAWNEASAINWVTDASAPVCFISSGLPRYSDGRDSIAGLYDKAGIYYERHSISVDVHPFWFFSPWAEEAVEYAVRFLDRLFKGGN